MSGDGLEPPTCGRAFRRLYHVDLMVDVTSRSSTLGYPLELSAQDSNLANPEFITLQACPSTRKLVSPVGIEPTASQFITLSALSLSYRPKTGSLGWRRTNISRLKRRGFR